ncbi:SDR family NAD(P)-dependent oxidoreductase [Elioraea tepidiphila]|jgi:NAD(P)-dependent dehydrogenase (short-subunit alcohol dehydrogenase family)|uniref:SDR family NAD(P)-dependent oxidoreductase n=1 Tax=Elioraea tepidiphila TaxID=457934 RepID=UPI000373C675|nr:SDR family NAD(P)-dependent oxidoreductase [Elioraea tepidiphila]
MAVSSSETRIPTTPSFRLDGKRALVTGASRGLGRAIAIAFAEAGAEVVLAARAKDEMDATVAAIAGRSLPKAVAVALDVTDRAAVRRVVAEHGPFDVLLNNAGTNIREPFLELNDASVDALLDLNIRAAVTVAHAVAQGMVAAGKGGAIINLSSVNGHVAGVNRSIYTATKHALEGLTKAMAVELGPHGIRVNAICPTFIETPLTVGLLSDETVMARSIRAIPLGRIGQVEDVMGAAVFLASPAAALINGASLLIDGGMTCL